MTKPLPSLGTLIQDAWNLYISTWNASLKFSIWVLYIGLINFVVLIIPPLNVLIPAVSILTIVAMIWAGIRMVRATLELETGKTFVPNAEEMKQAVALILPMIWAGFLQACIVLGGLIALIIPGLYFINSFSFTNFALIDKNQRGLAALQTSRQLVKGRWWGTFWRLVIGTVVFSFAIATVSSIVMTFISLIIGTNHVAGLTNSNLPPTARAVMTLFQSIIQAVAIPLILAYQVKLYRALSHTADKK